MIDTNVSAEYADTYARKDYHGSGSNILQISFDSGITGAVALYGRVAPDMGWVKIGDDITTTSLVPLLPVSMLRAVVTVTGGGGGSARIRVASQM